MHHSLEQLQAAADSGRVTSSQHELLSGFLLLSLIRGDSAAAFVSRPTFYRRLRDLRRAGVDVSWLTARPAD